MTEKEKSAYISFMCNPKNSHNCIECPENTGNFKDDVLPCGQQNCWVDCHCGSRKGE